MALLNEKRLQVGGIQVGITIEEAQAKRIRQSLPYRAVVGPALRWFQGQSNGNGSKGNGSNGHHPAVHTLPATPKVALPTTPEARAILERIAGIEWYHTIDLPHGVTTPGFADHRNQLHLYALPEDMRGMRALDVATYDGFWAFEMERRGAEVTAIDIGSWAEFDIPRAFRPEAQRSGVTEKKTGKGFWIAHELLESKVERHVLSVYELSPEKLGTFDFVFLSDLLLHLRDPQRALENVCSVVRETGSAVIADVYNPRLEHIEDRTLTEFSAFGEYVWWLPSTSTLKAMMKLAGFKRVEELARFCLAATSEELIHKVMLRGYPSSAAD